MVVSPVTICPWKARVIIIKGIKHRMSSVKLQE